VGIEGDFYLLHRIRRVPDCATTVIAASFPSHDSQSQLQQGKPAMRIYERLPGRAHAVQPQRKRYDEIIATLSRRPIIVDDAAEHAYDQPRQRPARSVEPETSDA
jgi:hypothetical protein